MAEPQQKTVKEKLVKHFYVIAIRILLCSLQYFNDKLLLLGKKEEKYLTNFYSTTF